VLAELTRDPTRLEKGPAWVAHMVLDHIVDQYMPVVDELDGAIEGLTNDALNKAGTPKGPPVLKRILRYKRVLQNMRRMSIHQREIFLRVGRVVGVPRPRRNGCLWAACAWENCRAVSGGGARGAQS